MGWKLDKLILTYIILYNMSNSWFYILTMKVLTSLNFYNNSKLSS